METIAKAEFYQSGVGHLNKAYSLNKRHPGVILELGKISTWLHQFNHARNLLTVCERLTNDSDMLCQVYCARAWGFHIEVSLFCIPYLH